MSGFIWGRPRLAGFPQEMAAKQGNQCLPCYTRSWHRLSSTEIHFLRQTNNGWEPRCSQRLVQHPALGRNRGCVAPACPSLFMFNPKGRFKGQRIFQSFQDRQPRRVNKKKDNLKTPQCHIEWCLLLFHSTENKGVLYNWQFPTPTLKILQTHLGASTAPGDPASERRLK